MKKKTNYVPIIKTLKLDSFQCKEKEVTFTKLEYGRHRGEMNDDRQKSPEWSELFIDYIWVYIILEKIALLTILLMCMLLEDLFIMDFIMVFTSKF